MKHYRNLNGCVSKMHRVIYDAYDKGYVTFKLEAFISSEDPYAEAV